ncbi:hypothetical protein [Haloarchaeobius amylolyticus]|uniref:hypothetical protein n=1 Tax=Haloarchaeobius amylolyticus TaxID=1198296 RepID=UPI00226F9E54|nr:hypothetical protein [Haloarchaeobius amylolyticus]
MVREFEGSDKGKKVMTTDGDMIGRVDNVASGKAYVKPDATLSRGMRKKLGWTDEQKNTFELDHDAVEAISDDEIHVKSNL